MADHYKYLKLKASNKHARLANLWMTVNDEVADEQDDSETEEEGKLFFIFFKISHLYLFYIFFPSHF
jgi:hypothetical protein